MNEDAFYTHKERDFIIPMCWIEWDLKSSHGYLLDFAHIDASLLYNCSNVLMKCKLSISQLKLEGRSQSKSSSFEFLFPSDFSWKLQYSTGGNISYMGVNFVCSCLHWYDLFWTEILNFCVYNWYLPVIIS